MLKDMTDSKRIDQHVQSQSSVGTQFKPIAALNVNDIQSVMHPTIISRHFWPQFQTAKILMPGQLREYAVFRTVLERVVLNDVQYSRVLRARVHNVQTRQEITLALSSWQHPSRDSIARPHRHCGRSTHRSRVHRAFLGARYASRSCERAPTLCSLSPDVWTVSDLIERVGPLERSAALKALLAWVDRGVLREESDDADIQRFRLLESAPTDASSVPAGVGVMTAGSRAALTEEQPAVLTVQQQQAEQMKVYWKVRVALTYYLVLEPC